MEREIDSSSGDGFRADPDERLASAPAAPPWSRSARTLALVGAFALHALILGLVILEYRWNGQAAPPEQEIPVELVPEPPPEPKPPDPPKPSQDSSTQTKPLDIEPAHDAPRAANDEKVQRDAPDEKTKAPVHQDEAKAPGDPSAPDQPAQPSRQSEAQPAQQPPQPDPAKEANASDGAVAANSASPDAVAARAATPAPSQRVASIVGQPLPTWSKGGAFSTFNQASDVQLGSAAEEAIIATGKAKETYLTVLYGMIKARVHTTASSRGRSGEIVFLVDAKGNVLERRITIPSGSMELDAANLGAIGEAAPFPPPPTGAAVQLTLTY